MTTDYTKLLEKLVPSSDGEPVLTLRTATVDTVNTDGTVDLELGSGVIVPNVPCLDNVTTAAGLVVQVLSARGSLLVIGGSSKGGQKGFIFRDERSSAVGSITTTETVIQVHSFLAAAGVQYKVTGIQSVQSTVSTAADTGVVRLRWQTGPTLTSGGTEIDAKIAGSPQVSTGLNVPLFGVFTPTVSGQVTVGATLIRNGGTGVWSSFGAATQKDIVAVEAA